MAEAKKEVMSEELAMQEIERWADDNDIDLFTTMNNGEKLLDAGAPKLVKAMCRGSLVVNDKCEFEYTVSAKSPEGFAGTKLVLKRPTGAAYLGLDSCKENQGVRKAFALLSAMTGKDVGWFSKLDNIDYKILNIITSFFIAG